MLTTGLAGAAAAADPTSPLPRLPICGDQDGSEAPFVQQCPGFTRAADVQTYRVPGSGPVDVRFDFVFREAAYNNELLRFAVDDSSGSINGLSPGTPGYLAAAFGRAVIVFPSGANASTADVMVALTGGDLLAFFIVQGASLEALLSGNPGNEPGGAPIAFFSLDALSPDGNDHFVGFANASVSQFAFEDQTNGGDQDYDDVVFNVNPPLIPNGLCDGPEDCEDADPCTDDACGNGGVCSYAFNTALCDDGDACTAGDRCTAGTCHGVQSGQSCSDRRPVIIVPGIMGSDLENGIDVVWFDLTQTVLEVNDPWMLQLLLDGEGREPSGDQRCLDDFEQVCTEQTPCPAGFCVRGGIPLQVGNPVRYADYGDLQSFLESRGYTVYPFPYDWRFDPDRESTLEDFRRLVDSIAGEGPVDVIAHSQGGLVMRAYARKYADDPRIRTMIYLGTPHLGSPKAYATLKGFSQMYEDRDDILGLDLETAAVVTHNFPSVHALLPRYAFVVRNDALEDLAVTYADAAVNATLVTRANDFHRAIGDVSPGIRRYAINGSNQPTLLRLDVDDARGCMRGLAEKTGDGTVTAESSRGLEGVEYFYVADKHGDLPGNRVAQRLMAELLQGDDVLVVPDGASEAPIVTGDDWYEWWTCSPIRVGIRDAMGRNNALDSTGRLSEDIPGSTHMRLGHGEGGFLSAGGPYELTLEGTGIGLATLGIERRAGTERRLVASSLYVDVPVSVGSIARLETTPDTDAGPLVVDIDADGRTDMTVPPNGQPTIGECGDALRLIAERVATKNRVRRKLVVAFRKLRAGLVRRSVAPARRALRRVEKLLDRKQGQGAIDAQQVAGLKAIAARCVNLAEMRRTRS